MQTHFQSARLPSLMCERSKVDDAQIRKIGIMQESVDQISRGPLLHEGEPSNTFVVFDQYCRDAEAAKHWLQSGLAAIL